MSKDLEIYQIGTYLFSNVLQNNKQHETHDQMKIEGLGCVVGCGALAWVGGLALALDCRVGVGG